MPPERLAAAATTCTNGGGGPPHSPFSHLDLPFLISPHPPAHRSSSQSLLSSTHHPRSPQSPRPLPLLPSPHPPSPRPPLIFHHRPPQINGGDQRRNFPYPSHHHLQQPNVPPSSNPKTPPHSPFCKSLTIPSQQPQSPAPTSHRPPQINRDDQRRNFPYPSHRHHQPLLNTPSSLHLSVPILGSSHPLNITGAAVWRHGLSRNT